jgi:DNA-binding NarL/FixJ family response regulator
MVKSSTPARSERLSPGPAPLIGLLEALELLVAQARAYDQILPRSNYSARATAAALGELAQRALNEARHLEAVLQPVVNTSPNASPLSRRESEVLALAAQGLTNKEIAYRLGISERTVQFHMNSVFNKTATSSRTQAVSLALKNGWLEG